MALKQLIIRNYRSIKSLDIPLGPLKALIGPNNAGKSNILRALNLILGETWPTARSFSDKDYYNHDTSKSIEIEVRFDAPLSCDSDVWGFRLTCSAGDFEFVPVDASGDRLAWRTGVPKRVSAEMREEVPLLYLGLARKAEEQLRPTQWTLYGKLLRHLETMIDAPSRQKFRQEVEANLEQFIRPALLKTQRIVTDMIRQQSGMTVELEFNILDPLSILKSVRPLFTEGTLQHDPEDVGAGIQSALAIAIAKAYADIVRTPVVVAIEEPELYLHPHGCRHFYRLLKQLSDEGVQIIYTTHERTFVNLGDYKSIYLVRKGTSGTHVTVGRDISLPDDEEQLLKIWTKFDDNVNEAFFANVVILTEGFPDAVACRSCLQKLSPEVDLDKVGVSIIDCGGRENIPPMARGLKAFGIDTLALVDEDPGDQQTAACRAQIEQILQPENVFLQRPNLQGLFNLPRKPSRVESLRVFGDYLQSKDPPKVYSDLLNRLKMLAEKYVALRP